jgi:predicted nucleic acid-binding protein
VSEVVLDACVVLALVLSEERAEDVSRALGDWAAAETALHAPALAHYEIASGLTRSRAGGSLRAEDVAEAWEIVAGLGLILHEPADGERVVEIACELEWHSAYDAAYLALGERLGVEVWTLDGPLYRNASGQRERRVRIID